MNNVLSLVHAVRTTSSAHHRLDSDEMRVELLALHLEMIDQLRLERLGVGGNADFLTALIKQHEETAANLRLTLEDRKAVTARNGVTPSGSMAGE